MAHLKENGSVSVSPAFETLRYTISNEILQAIEDMGFKTMTEIQTKCIPHLLAGKNLRGMAKTGSGKTLAFLIPTVERISELNFQPSDGTGAIIISPTRELCIQIYGVLKKLLKYHKLTCGLIMGGTNINVEDRELSKGVNILVATPSRLLDHLEHKSFLFDKFACLVIDEADRICDEGFAPTMGKIIKLLPEQRQTMFFSATQSNQTMELSNLAINSEVVNVNVYAKKVEATVKELEHKFVTCPLEKKFSLLYHKLKNEENKKIMIFFTTCAQVKFYEELLNRLDIYVDGFHGRKRQNLRSRMFAEFTEGKIKILLCTNAGARGWDIPNLDLIIQYDPPLYHKDYIHRVGRTARAGNKGRALIFLTENQKASYLTKFKKLAIEQEVVDWDQVPDMTSTVKDMVASKLMEKAKETYKSLFKHNDMHHNFEEFMSEEGKTLIAQSLGLWNKNDLPEVVTSHTGNKFYPKGKKYPGRFRKKKKKYVKV